MQSLNIPCRSLNGNKSYATKFGEAVTAHGHCAEAESIGVGIDHQPQSVYGALTIVDIFNGDIIG